MTELRGANARLALLRRMALGKLRVVLIGGPFAFRHARAFDKRHVHLHKVVVS